MGVMPRKDKDLEASGHRTPPFQIRHSLQCLEMIECRPGIDMEVFADLPYRRGIASLFDKCSDEVEDLFLPGCQFHNPFFNLGLWIGSTINIHNLMWPVRTTLNPKHEIL